MCPIDLWEEASCPGVLGKGEKPRAVRTRSEGGLDPGGGVDT